MLLAIAEVLLGIAQVFWEIAKSAFGNRQIHLFHKNLRGKPPLESVFQNTVRQGRTQHRIPTFCLDVATGRIQNLN